jgi:uncharacterized phiE125 gp8 family phage protein
MIETLPPKRPAEDLDYRINAAGLLAAGETLVEAQSSIAVSGATLGSATWDDTSIVLWISGGTAGTHIRITADLRTSGGRTFQRVYVIPFGEPVSLEQAKAHLNIHDDDSHDEYIARLIMAARRMVENDTGLYLVQRPAPRETRSPQHGKVIPYWRPVVSVASVAYHDDTADQTLADFVLSEGSGLRATWPRARWGEFTITYTAGLSEEDWASGQYEDLRHAMMLLIGHWFDQREAVIVGTSASSVPLAYESLIRAYRLASV